MSKLLSAVIGLVLGIVGSGTALSAEPSVLTVVKERGVLKAGVTKDVPNFGFIDESGKHTGFDHDIVTEIAKRLGVKLEVTPVTSATRIPLLQQGRIDLVASTMTHYRSRDEAVDFSIGYFYSPQTIMVKKGSGIKSVADMAGKRAAASIGSGSIKQFVKAQPAVKMQTFESFGDTFLALRQGTIDAIVTDAVILAGLRANAPNPEEFEVLFNKEAVYGGGEYGLGVRENDSKWRDQINFLLQDMWLDGTWDKIFNKWLGPSTKMALTKEQLGFQMTVWE
jgi:polar amino acid transport system substrate-binding protein